MQFRAILQAVAGPNKGLLAQVLAVEGDGIAVLSRSFDGVPSPGKMSATVSPTLQPISTFTGFGSTASLAAGTSRARPSGQSEKAAVTRNPKEAATTSGSG